MSVPKHMRIVFRGLFTESPEEWSFSTKWDSVKALDADPGVDDIDASGILAAATGLFGSADWAGGMKMTEWRAYAIGTDSHMEGNPRQEIIATGAEPSGSAGVRFPPQVSLCVTTVSANRGPARFGRFYLPGPAAAVDSSWRVSVAKQTSYVASVTTFLKAVSDSIDVPTSQASVDMLNVSNIGTGTKQSVDHIRVGRVYDTQRRRRSQLLEEYLDSGHIDW